MNPTNSAAPTGPANHLGLRSGARRSLLRVISVLVGFALFAASCGGGGDTTESSSALTTPEPTVDGVALQATAEAEALSAIDPDLITAEELEAELAAAPTATAIPEVSPDLFATPIPTPTPPPPDDPWEVFILTAKDDAKFEVPVFDEPEGTAGTRTFVYKDESQVNYPLETKTYYGNKLVLMVTDGKPGDDFVQVMLPTRPNGTLGWVQTALFDWSSHNFHIDIDITNATVEVYEGEELIISSGAIMGEDTDRDGLKNTRTPEVEAYIDEKLDGFNAAYGPTILSIAAFSNDIKEFSGGLPKLALHGTDVPDKVGEYISNGCIRVPNDIITQIADTVPVGTQVRIFA